MRTQRWKTLRTRLGLGVVLNLISWDGSASFLDQSQSVVKQNQRNPGLPLIPALFSQPMKFKSTLLPVFSYTFSFAVIAMILVKKWKSARTLLVWFFFSGEKPFECTECGRRFARSTDLKVHMPVHSEDKPYKCGECEKMFTRFSTLKEHIRTHTGTRRKFSFNFRLLHSKRHCLGYSVERLKSGGQEKQTHM